jgi:hypothetical protein
MPPGKNPLTLPLVIVSALAAGEAVAIAFLVAGDSGRAQSASPVVVAASQPAMNAVVAPQGQTPLSKPAPAAAVARGKVGRRVESVGFGMTVEKVLHEPGTYKDMVRVGPDERYLALLIAVDNNTGGNAQLFPSQFRLQDAAGFGYDPLGVKGTMPALEWTTLGNRQTVRGHVDFVVPKSAQSLELVYAGVPGGGPPIQVELGE